jgi:hypothetical protein
MWDVIAVNAFSEISYVLGLLKEIHKTRGSAGAGAAVAAMGKAVKPGAQPHFHHAGSAGRQEPHSGYRQGPGSMLDAGSRFTRIHRDSQL